MYELVAFIFFSILTLGMFSISVFSKNILYSMSSLAGGMIFISGFFFLLDAEFLGVVQILVYTGAVMALYAFGMMFFNSVSDVKENIASKRLIYTLSVISALLLVLIVSMPLFSTHVRADMPISPDFGNTQAVGYVLFTKYLIPFELTAVMLLVAMIAGIILASKKMDKSKSLDDDGFIVKEGLR
ncbi:MAG: NADH:ubiquinone oxidoreductase subunit J [Proteobacteria bacterium]|nr:MAG: NADH:ubiquinone oxidoreductase subunit J [Pseudomonadota bacterium]